MKKIPAILFFLFFSITCFAQQTIKGRVVNAETGAVVPGCSIFISNSSKGTTANGNGYFELYNVPPGKHDLIISSIGYETNVFSFSDEQLPLQLKVELTIKVKELENVVLEPSTEEGWDKWGRMFMDNFVGNTENASQCKVKNEDAIRFRYYKKSNRVIAYCDEPVILENKALGYIISYQLENFEVNFSNGTASYLGYSFYQPMEDGGKAKQQKWEKKRAEAYNGSIIHFMRSLYSNQLVAEGFEVRRMVRTPNYEKQRVRNLYRASVIKKPGTGGEVVMQYGKPPFPKDSVTYYESVMRQQEYLETYGASLLTADSLVVETIDGFKGVSFDDYIFVTYKNELEEQAYVKNQFPPRKASHQRSYVTLLNDKLITVDKYGNYYNPQDFLTSVYWAWSEKMANSLPLEYEPVK